MRKRTAIAMTIGVCSAIAAYVAWCARPFYCKPLLELPSNLKPEAALAITEWHSKEEDFDRAPFSIEGLWRCLCEPWKEFRRVLVIGKPQWVSPSEAAGPASTGLDRSQHIFTVGAPHTIGDQASGFSIESDAGCLPCFEISVRDANKEWRFVKLFGEVRWRLEQW